MEIRELNEQEQNRRDAVTKLRELGIEPYPAPLFEVNATTKEIKEKYELEISNIYSEFPIFFSPENRKKIDIKIKEIDQKYGLLEEEVI